MQWSQLKKRIESNFAESIKGRIEIWNTLYRKSHDSEGEAWITIDKNLVFSFASYTYLVESYLLSEKIQNDTGFTDYRNPEHFDGYYQAIKQADQILIERGIFSSWQFNESLFQFLNISIEEAITSDNPIIRSLAIIDKRFGKRRLIKINISNEHPIVQFLHEFRCLSEGITHPSKVKVKSSEIYK